MDNNFLAMAMNMIEKNPNMLDTPMKREMFNALKSGDSAKGMELAQNLCSTYGMNPAEASQSAQQFVMSRFQRRQ